MRPSAAVWIGVFIVVLAGAYALAQQQPGERGAAASFAVSPAGEAAVLVDTRTGQTWLLKHSAEKTKPAVWLPIERIDEPEDAAKWHARNETIAKVVAERAKDIERLGKLKETVAKTRAISSTPEKVTALITLEREISELEAKLGEK